MFRHLLVWAALAALLTPGVRATDKTDSDDETSKALSKIAQLGPGVHAIKKDAKGRITSCIVVGKSRISTVLGQAKGQEIARQRADMDAKAQFVKWVKESVSVHSKTDDEAILFLEGNEGNDKDALRESGKAIEKTDQRIESTAQGLVRGLQVLYVDVNSEAKTYTLVMGWEAKTAEATKKVEATNNSGPKKAGPPKANGPDAPGTPPATDKKIEDKKIASPDAKRFLP